MPTRADRIPLQSLAKQMARATRDIRPGPAEKGASALLQASRTPSGEEAGRGDDYSEATGFRGAGPQPVTGPGTACPCGRRGGRIARLNRRVGLGRPTGPRDRRPDAGRARLATSPRQVGTARQPGAHPRRGSPRRPCRRRVRPAADLRAPTRRMLTIDVDVLEGEPGPLLVVRRSRGLATRRRNSRTRCPGEDAARIGQYLLRRSTRRARSSSSPRHPPQPPKGCTPSRHPTHILDRVPIPVQSRAGAEDAGVRDGAGCGHGRGQGKGDRR